MPGPDMSKHPLAKAGGEVKGDKPEKDRGPITLAQFLKVVNAAETGGSAKALVRDGGVTVNGEAEDRPGRKLAKGDVVVVGGETFTVDR